jgi:transcriptional activator protein UGA3
VPTPSSRDVTPQLPTSIDPWEALPGDHVAERKHLLRYYIEAFVPSISVANTPSSFYTSLYIPMAFQSEGMLDAIIAQSSAQLARKTVDLDRAQHLRNLSLKHQYKVHLFLRERLSSSGEPVNDTYQVVGTLLLLVGLEALLGAKDTKWLSQVQCARKILNSLCEKQNSSGWELESLRRHFTYYDAMAALMAAPASAQQPSSRRDWSAFNTPQNTTLTIDPLMGISYHLCSLICRIQYVTASKPAFPHLFKAAFKALERDIQQWKYDSPFSSPSIDLPLALDLIALAEAYRLAALIHLYRRSEAHKDLIPACAERAMAFISRIPPGSPAESSLLYPMFLAGAELDTEAEITKCLERLIAIQQRNHYENIANVREVLQQVWKPALSGGEKRDWEDVLKELGWSFSLG